MALTIDDAHIEYYHMDAVRSLPLGYGYFLNPDYLVITSWIHALLLFPDQIILTKPLK